MGFSRQENWNGLPFPPPDMNMGIFSKEWLTSVLLWSWSFSWTLYLLSTFLLHIDTLSSLTIISWVHLTKLFTFFLIKDCEENTTLTTYFSFTLKKKNLFYLAVPGLSHSMQDLQFWHMRSSSLTRDWTQNPLHWKHGVLANGPPGNSLSHFCMNSKMCDIPK